MLTESPQVIVLDGSPRSLYDLAFDNFVKSKKTCVPMTPEELVALTQWFPRLPQINPAIGRIPPSDQRREIDNILGARKSRRFVASSNRRFDDAARLLALGTSARLEFVDDLEDAIPIAAYEGSSSAVLFSEPHEVTEAVLAKTWRGIENDSVFGFVPARSPSEARHWVTKRLLANIIYSEHRGVSLYVRDLSIEFFQNQIGVVTESQFCDLHAQSIAVPRQITLFEFHAKECCAKFNDFVFCGKPSTPVIANGLQAIPGCCCGSDCVWPYARVPIGCIDSAHIVAVSCGSLRLSNNLFVDAVGLGLNAFAGRTRSYLSANRFLCTNSMISAYAVDIMHSATSLGAVWKSLNEFLVVGKSDSPSFVLLGDPDDAIDLRLATEQSQDPRSGTESRTSIERAFSRRAGQTHEKDFRECPPSSYGVIGASSIRDGSELEKLVPTELVEELGSDRRMPALIEWIVAQDNRDGLWLPLKYSKGQRRVLGSTVDCPNCGRSAVVHEHLLETNCTRIFVNCPLCGIISDFPQGLGKSCELASPLRIRRNESFEAIASLDTGICGNVEWAICGFSLIHCTRFGFPEFEHFPVRIDQGVHIINAAIAGTVPKTAYPFAYWIRATWLSDRGLFWLSRPLIIE